MRRVLELVIIFIMVAIVLYVITGCSQINQHRAWVSVEKAPMRIIYVDDSDKMDHIFIGKLVNHVGSQEYKDYYFNESTSISIAGNRSDIESDTDIHSRSVIVGSHEQEIQDSTM